MPITVFTNGCFDILHSGHVQLLEYARSFGDQLIVGVNSDSSCRQLKGPGRPIISCTDRVAVLLALRCVDKAYVFDEPTPEALICELCPDVLVKGPAAKTGPIPGAKWVIDRGGKVIVPDWPVTISTTAICSRIMEAAAWSQ